MIFPLKKSRTLQKTSTYRYRDDKDLPLPFIISSITKTFIATQSLQNSIITSILKHFPNKVSLKPIKISGGKIFSSKMSSGTVPEC